MSDNSGQGGNEMTHTKTPWSYEPQEFIPERIWAGTRLIAQVVGDSAETQENAAFIVRAVNSHDKLVKALEESNELLNSILDASVDLKALSLITRQLTDNSAALREVKT